MSLENHKEKIEGKLDINYTLEECMMAIEAEDFDYILEFLTINYGVQKTQEFKQFIQVNDGTTLEKKEAAVRKAKLYLTQLKIANGVKEITN